MSDFKERVLEVVRSIPEGKTMTYAEVAAAAGSKGAHRAVGSIMKANFDPTVPCHRVIKSDGQVGEYNRGGPFEKLRILEEEGAFFMAVDDDVYARIDEDERLTEERYNAACEREARRLLHDWPEAISPCQGGDQ